VDVLCVVMLCPSGFVSDLVGFRFHGEGGKNEYDSKTSTGGAVQFT
jgi:hypothetical protein